MMPKEKANATVMLEVFNAIERRDPQRLAELGHPDVEFSWPAALPYGGTTRGFQTEGPTWIHTWAPLQPTEAERSMEPRVVGSTGDEVVVLWRQRGQSKRRTLRWPRARSLHGPRWTARARRCSTLTPRRWSSSWGE
jgi:ketosteroid isomerase-like protein